MTDQRADVQQELLREAKRQTELLGQINWLLWAFAGLSLLAVVVAVSFG